MGDKSGIQWTEATWNPTTGCTRVSPGCDHCYAFQLHDQRFKANRDAARSSDISQYRYGGHATPTDARTEDVSLPFPPQYDVPFSQVQVLDEHRLTQPLRWTRGRRIFVDSMSDLFHEDVPDEAIDRVFGVMAATPQHTYQVLTKRPERMREYVARAPKDDSERFAVIDNTSGAHLVNVSVPSIHAAGPKGVITGLVATPLTAGALERRGLLWGETVGEPGRAPRRIRWVLSEAGEDAIRAIFPFEDSEPFAGEGGSA